MAICEKGKKFLRVIFVLAGIIASWSKFVQGYEAITVGTKFELIHRDDHLRDRVYGEQPISEMERLRNLLRRDAIRFVEISRKARLNKLSGEMMIHSEAKNNLSGEMMIHSGADYGTGQYFVHFNVGSPAQRVVLIADTGSDLTWMNCKYNCRGGRCRRDSNRRRIFLAENSSTFKTLPCSSSICKVELANLFSLSRCPLPLDPCAYDYRFFFFFFMQSQI